jgi:tetratricopeptide (TPR) repeat protein
MKEFERVVKLDPLFYGAFNNLANAYLQRKDFVNAIKYYEATLKIKNDYFDSVYNLGYALMVTKDYARAEKYFRQTVSLQKGYVDGWYNLGIVLFNDNRMDESGKAFEETVKLQPDNFDAHMRLAAIYEKKDLNLTIHHINELIRINPGSGQAYANLGSAYYKLGEKEKAFDAWKKLLEVDPGSPAAKQVRQFLR